MFRKKQILTAFAAITFAFAMHNRADAQYYPPNSPAAAYQGLNNIVAQNLAFDQAFYPWAWQMSQQVARQMPPGSNPFNAMTISKSISEGNQAFGGYINQLQVNSDRTSQAVGNWTKQGITGISPYSNGYGPNVWLPYGPNSYYQDQYGVYRPGAPRYGNGYTPQ